jgi:hypothetical protein
MQQQMFDHMQQTLAAMAQTINAAHARQLDSIREELIRMQEVNGELQELNGELSGHHREQPDTHRVAIHQPPSSTAIEDATNLIPAPAATSFDTSPLAAPRSGTGRPPSDALRPPIRGSGLDSLAE